VEHKKDHELWLKEYSHWKGLRCGTGKGYFCRRHGMWITCTEVEAGLASQCHDKHRRCPDRHDELMRLIDDFYKRHLALHEKLAEPVSALEEDFSNQGLGRDSDYPPGYGEEGEPNYYTYGEHGEEGDTQGGVQDTEYQFRPLPYGQPSSQAQTRDEFRGGEHQSYVPPSGKKAKQAAKSQEPSRKVHETGSRQKPSRHEKTSSRLRESSKKGTKKAEGRAEEHSEPSHAAQGVGNEQGYSTGMPFEGSYDAACYGSPYQEDAWDVTSGWGAGTSYSDPVEQHQPEQHKSRSGKKGR